MSAIYPVPTTRTSNLLGQVRLTAQLQSDQLDILRLQSQISTGRRIATPSDDAPAAQRATSLQRLLELKAQARVNLDTSASYLNASDSALSSASYLITQARATALSVADTTSSDTARRTAAAEVQRTIDQLMAIGNQSFRGRYLFAGSRTPSVPPFQASGANVTYTGNQGEINSFADIDSLLASNIPGSEIFGTFSPGVIGNVDLNPIATEQTRLSDLRGGQGITPGSIAISDGSTTQTIDISSAVTLGDLTALIEANSPTGRTVTARVTGSGLTIDIDDAGGGNLSIREVGGGTTAAELGILNQVGSGTAPIVGADLDPKLRLTTALANVLGARASVLIDSPGPDNDVLLEARQRGTAANGINVQFVDDSLLHASPGLNAGNETASYSIAAIAARAALPLSGFGNNLLFTGNVAGTSLNNVQIELVDAGAIGNTAQVNFDPGTKVLSIGIDSTGATTALAVINAVNGEGTFTAAHDASDPVDGAFNPAASVSSADVGAIRGNTGNSGGNANTIYVNIDPGATTANHVVAALQGHPTVNGQFTVRIDEHDISIPLAAGGGFVSVDAAGATAGGSGTDFDQASGLQIFNGGQTYTVNFLGAETVEDLLNTLNGSPAQVLAEIDPAGTGINIRSRLSGTDFRIGENGGSTATQLGVRSLTAETFLSDLNYGRGITTAAGADFTIQRNDGVNLDIDVTGAQTIGDVLDLINSHPANLDPLTQVVARLAAFGNGIELVDDNPTTGTLTVVKAFQSEAAWDLGLVPLGQSASAPPQAAPAATANLTFPSNPLNTAFRVSALQSGTAFNGVDIILTDVFAGDVANAVYNAGTRQLTISIDASATTANTIISAINVEGTFTASRDLTVDTTNDGTGVVGTTGVIGTTSGGNAEQITGRDTNPQEVAGVFNSLIRLNDALLANDLYGIERATEMLDIDLDRVNFGRADIGSRGQGLDLLRGRLDDEEIQLKAALSAEIDTDITVAVSSLAARQAALQASLQLSAQSLRLTLLDFL